MSSHTSLLTGIYQDVNVAHMQEFPLHKLLVKAMRQRGWHKVDTYFKPTMADYALRKIMLRMQARPNPAAAPTSAHEQVHGIMMQILTAVNWTPEDPNRTRQAVNSNNQFQARVTNRMEATADTLKDGATNLAGGNRTWQEVERKIEKSHVEEKDAEIGELKAQIKELQKETRAREVEDRIREEEADRRKRKCGTTTRRASKRDRCGA
ncbi:hypothetical protein FN846DRAFT_907844 [Sphaerosporella brunnea]|uniref:Uncharacterized protein n=1 Tax=Sphaerosporella brunnea TaxID=1250544 RepID=A0A5J5EW17_9PEZI|nr:hypothetical protein FN846DRAFT_907844 [Sphaerosporella brunnea]